ncbi:MAG: hypothetical protein MUE94_05985 [Verrucomicrobia bacterium]|jgi:hypothetical protein|nr:hypothetical protein [Verrucomicrobiota bacterium]
MTTSNSASQETISRHVWRFFRSGGVDQVMIRSGSDIAHLEQLDLKLWMALAMPTRGIEFDPRTLDLVDTDKDGRIRPPEVLAAIQWARGAFRDLEGLIKGGDSVPLASIQDEGIRKGAQRILSNLGKANATSISLAEVEGMTKDFTQTRLNGDGIVPVGDAEDEATRKDIADILAALGGVTDRSGKPGVDQATLDKFFAEAQALSDWHKQGEQDKAVLAAGDQTASAYAAVQAVKVKVEDYFARGRLAAFDARATAAVNRQEAEYLSIAAQDLTITAQEVAGFPLARIEPGKPLSLSGGLNPAWAGAIGQLASQAVTPLLGSGKTSLSEADWAALQAKLAPYAAWQAAKPVTGVEKIGVARARELLAGDAKQRIAKLIAADAALAPEYAQMVSVEKLVRFQRDLVKLLANYVNFAEFYGRRGAVFQSGVLYLDARSCHLCLDVVDAGKHATLAGLAGAYLAYCDCTRPDSPKRTIVAAFTDGDADNLMVGRNGVFYDRKGRDWDATITKVVTNPISLREAFWSPYKKLLRTIEEMVAKRAAAAEAASDKKLAAAAETVATADKSKPAEPKKIDVGTVAALGVAVGAIGTAVTGLATGLMNLAVWQIPLVFVGIILIISLPSMIIAWLKLRRRNIAPILDANGWAINTRAKMNVPFGAALTHVAKLPANAERSLDDPFAEKKRPWGLYIFLLVLVVAAVWIRVDHKKRGHYFWQKPAAAAVTNAVPSGVNSNAVAAAVDTNQPAK